jgi:acetyltransferase-like isoleucine patch superfamily enzyme
MFYSEPLFRSCARVGKGLYLEKLPAISGKVDIRVGDDVTISGALEIAGGRVYPESRLIVGNRVYLAHDVKFFVCQEILIEDGAWIAQGSSVADNDGHAMDFDDRLRGLPPAVKEVEPVRIGKNAWIGRGCRIMRGVTIGEGALVGAGSVVRTDIPAFGVALGNPARVVRIVQPQSKAERHVQEELTPR